MAESTGDIPRRPRIKHSKRLEVQTLVEGELSNLSEKHPGVEATALVHYARDRVASTLRRGRIKKELQKSQELAYRDQLTGLYNRRWFEEELERKITEARRDNSDFYVVFMDIDRFKLVNTEFGHSQGDQILKIMADLHARKDEPIARLGGEEFVQIIRGDISPSRVETVMRRHMISLDMLSSLVFSKLHPIQNVPDVEKVRVATVSFGAVKYNREQIETPQEMLNLASQAALYAKEQGRNQGFLATKDPEGTVNFEKIKVR